MARQIREITIEPGRSFRVVADDQMKDPYAQALLHSLYWLRSEWRLLSRFLPEHGGRFLDLGSHLGSFALTAAAHGVEVLAVEASPTNAAMLQASVDLNEYQRMSVVNAAIYKEPCTLRFFENGPFGFLVEHGDERLPKVPAMPVRDILAQRGWEHVDLIKMDIEGAEVWAVEGMDGLLSHPEPPVIYYECNGRTLNDFGHSSCRELRARLEAHGYTSFVHVDDRTPLRPVRADELQPEVDINCLAVKLSRFTVKRASLLTRLVRNRRRRRRGEQIIAGWLKGWPVGFAATEMEQIAAFRQAISQANELSKTADEPMIAHQHLLRELERAPAWLSADPMVRAYRSQHRVDARLAA